MFLLPTILIGVVLALAAGGDLKRLSLVRFRFASLVLAALVIQIVVFGPLGARLPVPARETAHIGSYLLLLGFGLANRRVRALVPMVAGTALNALVVIVNGGSMLVSQRATAAAGFVPGAHANVSEQAMHLRWLGDVFAMPSVLPYANVFSVGDVLVGVGAIWFITAASTTRPSTQSVTRWQQWRLPPGSRSSHGTRGSWKDAC